MYTLGLEKCLEMASFSNDKGAKRLILNLWEKYHNTLNAPYNKEIFLRQIRSELLIKLSHDDLTYMKAMLLSKNGYINNIVD